MGSYSYGYSSTAYNNTPQTVSENGLALSGSNLVSGAGAFSGTQTNTSQLTGSTINNLDGGAIASAFGFGSELIKGLFQSQKDNNAAISAANSQANGLISKSQELVDKKENLPANALNMGAKTVWILAGVVAAYFVYRGAIK